MTEENLIKEVLTKDSRVIGELPFGQLVHTRLDNEIDFFSFNSNQAYPLREVAHLQRPLDILQFETNFEDLMYKHLKNIGVINRILDNEKCCRFIEIFPMLNPKVKEGKVISDINWKLGIVDILPSQISLLDEKRNNHLLDQLRFAIENNPFPRVEEDITAIFKNFTAMPFESIDRLKKVKAFLEDCNIELSYRDPYTQHSIRPGNFKERSQEYLAIRNELTSIDWPKTWSASLSNEEIKLEFSKLNTLNRFRYNLESNNLTAIDWTNISLQMAIVEQSFKFESDRTKQEGSPLYKNYKRTFILLEGIPIRIDSESEHTKDEIAIKISGHDKRFAYLQRIIAIQSPIRGYGNKGNG
jgi:hypothetical protein